MRFFILATFLSGLLLTYSTSPTHIEHVDASGEAPAVLQPSIEEKTHERPAYYSWNYQNLPPEYIPLPSLQLPFVVNQSDQCQEGWHRFANSCYWIETELLGFPKAERKCFEKQSTLFVANSLEEWNTIRTFSKAAYFSWVGLVRFTKFEKSEQFPRWQTEGGIDPAELNWLFNPYKPLTNGWTKFANCVASFKSPVALESASYMFFYPCNYLFYSICERNSTITHLLP